MEQGQRSGSAADQRCVDAHESTLSGLRATPLGSGEVEASDFAERAGMFSGGGPIGWDHAQVCLLLRVQPVVVQRPITRATSSIQGFPRVPFGSQRQESSLDKHAQLHESFGSPTWARTRDLRINSPSLYQLSYRGTSLPLYFFGGFPVNRVTAPRLVQVAATAPAEAAIGRAKSRAQAQSPRPPICGAASFR